MAEFVTVMKEFARMCRGKCSDCPLSQKNNGINQICSAVLKRFPEEAENIIMEWAAEHPVETMKDRFFKMFPNAKVDDDGTPKCCPHHLGWAERCWKYEANMPSCSECWNRPYEERSAE